MLVETKAKLRHLRLAPRKVRLVIDLIRGLKVDKAINQLEGLSKEATKPVLKLLNSAIANAKHNHDLNEDSLRVKETMVDNGPIMYRWMPRAMGRATPIRKRTCHITIVLTGEVLEKKVKKEEKEKKEKVINKKTTENKK